MKARPRSKNRPNKTVRTQLDLSISGTTFSLSADLPAGPTTTRKMLPVFRSVCTTVISETVKNIESQGRSISCCAGCGACCRQMVPLSSTEIAHIKEVVEKMPTDRREQITARFSDAVSRFEDSGLIDELRLSEKPSGSAYHDLGLAYFAQGVACPFLEDESCSIHKDRPLICREYLVVSPAENCKRQNGQPVEVLGLPLSASKALAKVDGDVRFNKWIPMILALEQPDHPEPAVSGAGVANEFFSNLVGRKLTQ